MATVDSREEARTYSAEFSRRRRRREERWAALQEREPSDAHRTPSLVKQPRSRQQQQQLARVREAGKENAARSSNGSTAVRYAESISKRAVEHRSQRERQDTNALVAKIEGLEAALSKHRENEHKLQNVNARLQDRLIVFQKQNADNVALAKAKIIELQSQLREQQNTILLNGATTPTPAAQRDLGIERSLREKEALFAWKLAQRRRALRKRCLARRVRETKQRVLRVWACGVLTQKILEQARARRIAKVAARCLSKWQLFLWRNAMKRCLDQRARQLYERRIMPRRVLRAWRAEARSRGRDRAQRALCKAFYGWKQASLCGAELRLLRAMAA